MERLVAYCGLVCSDCSAYIATQANDPAALERVAAQWREEYNAPTTTVEDVICDGCVTEGGHKCSHCPACDIRACGVERGMVNCAYCADYPCEKLERFFASVPDARAVLDEIRSSGSLV